MVYKNHINKKINSKANNRGITLIALVVTIVVLLILAGISISIVLGEGGIIDSARKAGELTNAAIANEQQMLQNVVDWVDEYLGGNGGSGSTNTETPPPPEEPVPETLEEAMKNKYEFKENKEYTDETNKKVTIPAEYHVVGPEEDSSVDYGTDKKPTVDEGIVISDSLANGSEFVWVPVEEITQMVICQTHGTSSTISYDKATGTFNCSQCSDKVWKSVNWENRLLLAGKLYATSTGNSFNASTTGQKYTANSGLREPDVLTDTTNGDASTSTDPKKGMALLKEIGIGTTTSEWSQMEPIWKKQLQDDFDEMIESVAKYGGFYIGRYETGGLSNENPQGTTAVVKAGQKNGEINNTNWYNMYVESKNIAKDKKGVTSSMIWGSQWDQVMLWMQNEKNPTVEGNPEYIKNSSGMGWYSDNKANNSEHETGKDLEGTDGKVLNRVKNIYDMAGNVYEWTLEAYYTDNRVSRGGSYNLSGSNDPASRRSSGYPYYANEYVGSRSTLLCNPES